MYEIAVTSLDLEREWKACKAQPDGNGMGSKNVPTAYDPQDPHDLRSMVGLTSAEEDWLFV